MIGNDGSKQVMSWLFETPAGQTKPHLELLSEKGFSAAQVVKIIGNNGSKQVMSWLFETPTGQTNHHLELLIDKGFSIDQVVKMIGNDGAKQVMSWLFEMAQGQSKNNLELLIEIKPLPTIVSLVSRKGVNKKLRPLGIKNILQVFRTHLPANAAIQHIHKGSS